MKRETKENNRAVVNGKIKGTSAFNIQKADSLNEISWSKQALFIGFYCET